MVNPSSGSPSGTPDASGELIEPSSPIVATRMRQAIANNNMEMLHRVLDRHPDSVRWKLGQNGGTALHVAAWRGYFGFAETRSVLRDLDSWLRRRLRSLLWKRWKVSRVRFAELTVRGVSRDLAAQTCGSPHGPWRLSRSPALNIALPTSLWKSLGLPTLAT